MPVAISTLGLNRVRRTDPAPQLTVNGTGFSAANNSVFVSGSLAAIVAQGATQITFNLPAPFSLNVFDVRSIHVPILVVNNDTGETSTEAWTWIKADPVEVADERIDTAIPGPFEITSAPEVPDRFEARDMQRLAALVESLTVDVQAGNVLAWDGAKLAEPAGLKGSGGGQILRVDLAEPTGLAWAFNVDAFLKFGRSLAASQVSNLIACQSQLAFPGAAGDENFALDDGTLDLISLKGRASGGGTVVLVRVLVDGVQQYTSGAISVINYSQAISVAVTKGQRIQLQVSAGPVALSSIALTGGIRLLVD